MKEMKRAELREVKLDNLKLGTHLTSLELPMRKKREDSLSPLPKIARPNPESAIIIRPRVLALRPTSIMVPLWRSQGGERLVHEMTALCHEMKLEKAKNNILRSRIREAKTVNAKSHHHKTSLRSIPYPIRKPVAICAPIVNATVAREKPVPSISAAPIV